MIRTILWSMLRELGLHTVGYFFIALSIGFGPPVPLLGVTLAVIGLGFIVAEAVRRFRREANRP